MFKTIKFICFYVLCTIFYLLNNINDYEIVKFSYPSILWFALGCKFIIIVNIVSIIFKKIIDVVNSYMLIIVRYVILIDDCNAIYYSIFCNNNLKDKHSH